MSKAVPRGWTEIRLGQYLKEIKERNGSHGNHPVLSVTNTQGFVQSEEYFERKVYSKNLDNYKIVRKGQFAYNPSRLNVGSLARLKNYDAGLLSPMYVIFETLSDIDADFLSHWLKSGRVKNLIKVSTQGTVRDSVNYSALAAFLLALPPLPEQLKIATILSSVDDAIEKTKAVIEQTKVVKKGLMQELLTRGIPGRHKKFKKTPVGEIPEEWDVVRLKDIAKVQTGVAKNSKKKKEKPITLPYLRVANVQDGFVDLSEIKHIVIDKNKAERYLLQKGDVLFNEGGDNDKLGRGCVWEAKINPCVHQNHVFAVRCSSKISPYYLAIFAASPIGKQFFLNAAKQTTNLASINSSQLKLFPVPLPSPEEQHKIISIIRSIDNNLTAKQELLDSMQNIKTALMQVLLTGEVRVKI